MNPQEPASGRFVLRLDPGLHESLRAAARARGVSLNEYCATKLAMPVVDGGAFAGASVVIKRAAAVVGEALIAVVAFGSWARGELADSSDIDILIVVDADVPISRSLYRRWDEEPLRWEGHPVEPHFVHLPALDGVPSGLWAEIALDGIVLYQRDPTLSQRLVGVRRLQAVGRLRRRTAHGQPYWVEA